MFDFWKKDKKNASETPVPQELSEEVESVVKADEREMTIQRLEELLNEKDEQIRLQKIDIQGKKKEYASLEKELAKKEKALEALNEVVSEIGNGVDGDVVAHLIKELAEERDNFRAYRKKAGAISNRNVDSDKKNVYSSALKIKAKNLTDNLLQMEMRIDELEKIIQIYKDRIDTLKSGEKGTGWNVVKIRLGIVKMFRQNKKLKQENLLAAEKYAYETNRLRKELSYSSLS